jgi:hypothetical protein
VAQTFGGGIEISERGATGETENGKGMESEEKKKIGRGIVA